MCLRLGVDVATAWILRALLLILLLVLLLPKLVLIWLLVTASSKRMAVDSVLLLWLCLVLVWVVDSILMLLHMIRTIAIVLLLTPRTGGCRNRIIETRGMHLITIHPSVLRSPVLRAHGGYMCLLLMMRLLLVTKSSCGSGSVGTILIRNCFICI